MAVEKETNKRKHERVFLSLLVQYRFNTIEDFLSEYSANISMGGMFVNTPAPKTIGSLIYFQFVLNDGAKLIEGLGRVTWVNRNISGQTATLPPGMGIEFINMDEDSLVLIREIVENKIGRSL